LASRPAVGEVVGSVSMLAVTIALLGGASYLALSSIDGAANLVGGSAQQEAREAGLLLGVVGSQTNATGSYVWLLDYGWESSQVGSVLVNAQPVPWSTTCVGDWSGTLCVVKLPAGATGLATIVLGGKSLEVSI
jgi:hypothetical protein